MTEPIDQATKDLIEDEAEQWFKNLPWMESYKFQLVKEGYIAGATLWAEKLKQLETQSHDQVRIIEHLEQELAKERELRKELVDGFLKLFQMELHIPSEHWVEWSEYHKQIESLIQKAKDKSHE